MNIQEAIKNRHSVRQYKDMPIDGVLVSRLKEIIDDCNRESGLNIQLVLDEPECFDTLLAHYGKFRNAKNYVAIVGKRNLPDLAERGGYYGQRIVLEAQMMGLNTCWVAGTYKKGKCKAVIGAGDRIVCVIAIGYGVNEGTQHKSKPIEKICAVKEEDMPSWFKDGLVAALMAPTALNQQKFHVALEGGEAVITAGKGPLVKLDLGIVKYNFEAASGHKCR